MSQFIIDGQGRLYAVPSYPNYLAHARIKGSKNGYHLFGDRDYTPVGDKAKGPQLQTGATDGKIQTISTASRVPAPNSRPLAKNGSQANRVPAPAQSSRTGNSLRGVFSNVASSVNSGKTALTGTPSNGEISEPDRPKPQSIADAVHNGVASAVNAVDSFLRNPEQTISAISEFVGNSAKAVTDAVSNAFNASVSWVNQAANTVKNAVGSVVDAVIDTAGRVANWATAGYNAAKNWIGGLISGVQAGYSNARTNGRDVSGTLSPVASTPAGQSGSDIGNRIGGFAGNAVNTGERAAGAATDWIRNTANNVGGAISNTASNVASAADRAWNGYNVTNTAPANAPRGYQSADNITEHVNGIRDNVGGGLSQAGQWINNAANDVGNAYGGFVNGLQSGYNTSRLNGQDMSGMLIPVASTSSGQFGSNIGNGIGGFAGNLVNMGDAAGRWFGNAANDVSNWATGAYNNVSGQAVQLYNNAVNGFNQALANFRANPTVDNQNALQQAQQSQAMAQQEYLRYLNSGMTR